MRSSSPARASKLTAVDAFNASFAAHHRNASALLHCVNAAKRKIGVRLRKHNVIATEGERHVQTHVVRA